MIGAISKKKKERDYSQKPIDKLKLNTKTVQIQKEVAGGGYEEQQTDKTYGKHIPKW